MTAKEAGADLPVVLVKWYEYLKWLIDRIDQFPKNQRYLLGQRKRLTGTPRSNSPRLRTSAGGGERSDQAPTLASAAVAICVA